MHWRSKLVHPQAKAPEEFRSLATPTYRGSTVLFDKQEDVADDWRLSEHGYTYGLRGTPTTRELAVRLCELEGARHTFIVPGGLSALSLVYLTFCSSGCHVLLPSSAYGPSRQLAEGLLRRFNVEAERYDPLIGAEIAARIRPNTALIWCESPGSITMEVQDIPAIVAAAHARSVPVALDNTYAAGILLDAFALGVDVSTQALTKYVGGHSDLLLGSVSVRNEEMYQRLGETHNQLGMAVSPDDCSLALRGLQTLGIRLEVLERSTLAIAAWLQSRPEIETVLHPAFPSCPGHEHFKRDFTGSASLFSVIFHRRYSPQQINAFTDALRLFKIGFSWGGVTSLALAYPRLDRPGLNYAGRIVRFNIGLEQPEDLIADLTAAFATLPQ